MIEQVIPPRRDQLTYEGRRWFDRHAYRRRTRVEQCVGSVLEPPE
ncbi:MAG: hypothetical protein AB7K52_07105 [Phycisphaerales bacterium]